MRLWGGHGQRNIEEAHICVLGGGPTATESLKNLVLPNIGKFTVVDDKKVGVADLGNNWFVSEEYLGKSRALAIKDNMLEMNPEVKGNHVERAPTDVINEPEFFSQFTLVIASNVYGEAYKKLADLLQQKSIPLLSVRSNGYLGSLRIASPEICVIESHPDDQRTDISIHPEQLENFPELKEFLFSFDLSTMDEDIPAPAIIAQKIAEWMSANDGTLPNYSNSDQFKKTAYEGKLNFENYQEVKRHCSLGYNKPRLGPMVESILKNPQGETITPESDIFWIMVRGLRDFLENEGHGFMPVTTSIPDFHTSSKVYLQMKNIYKARATRDLELIKGYVRTRMEEVGQNNDLLDDSFIVRFVKNCRNLHVDQYKSVSDEYNSPDMEEIHEAFDEWDESMLTEEGDEAPKLFKPKLINWYLSLRLLDEFHAANSRLPGTADETLEEDKAKYRTLAQEWLKSKEFERDFEMDCLDELCRFGGSEMHATAAFMGGVCSQAALKLLLKQYYPFNHTFVYDGIYCQCKTFKI